MLISGRSHGNGRGIDIPTKDTNGLPRNTGIRRRAGTGCSRQRRTHSSSSRKLLSKDTHSLNLKRTRIWIGNISFKERHALQTKHQEFRPDSLSSDYAARKSGSGTHERTAVKAARCVLGRGEGGNTFSLFDGEKYPAVYSCNQSWKKVIP